MVNTDDSHPRESMIKRNISVALPFGLNFALKPIFLNAYVDLWLQ